MQWETHMLEYTYLQEKVLITLRKSWKKDETQAPVTAGKKAKRASMQ